MPRTSSGEKVGSGVTEGAFVSSLSRRMPRATTLSLRLEALAGSLVDCAEVPGAMVIAYEAGSVPVAFGASSCAVAGAGCAVRRLIGIIDNFDEDERWSEVQDQRVEIPGAHSVWGRNLLDRGEALGSLIVGFAEVSPPNSISELRWIFEYLKWAIQEALRFEELRYLQQLRELELRELRRLARIDPQRIARQIKELFNAEAVTIVVSEQEKLYFAGTTDRGLRERIGSYEPCAGLTNYIVETGKAVRLRDIHDLNELHAAFESEVPKEVVYPEALAEEDGRPIRLLAMPMRSGKTVEGVIRLLRKASALPFTDIEEKVLRHFSDTLAVVMQASWKLFLFDHLANAESEAICISRRETEEGHAIPKLVYADSGAEKLFGIERNELKGMDGRDLYSAGEYTKIRALIDEAITNGQSSCGPLKTKTNRFGGSERQIRSVEISYRFLTSPFVKPRSHYTIAVIRDRTQDEIRAEQHHRLMSLLEKKGLVYFRVDRGGRIVETTNAESRLTGYSLDELEGMPQRKLYYNPEERRSLVAEVDQRDGSLVHTTRRFRRKDGSSFWVEGQIHQLKDEEGRVLGYEGLYEDVTGRLELQGILDVGKSRILRERELYQKLEENTRFQLLFMASLSHQLRSPLGAVLEQLKNFEQGITDSARFSKRLRYAMGQVRVCSLLVANLTYMDKLLRGENFSFRQVSLARVAIETKLDFQHLARDRGLSILVDGESLDRYFPGFRGHGELMRQVFVNLVDNAIKYSIPDSKIRIEGKETPGRIYLEVSNVGLRVPKADRERIFERGARMRQAADLVPDGTGLGLWLVRKVLAAHEGAVSCTEVFDGAHRTAFQIEFAGQGPAWGRT